MCLIHGVFSLYLNLLHLTDYTYDIYLTRSLGFLKLLGQKLQQLANLGSVSSSTALSLISLIRSLSAADWARIRSDTEASSPGSFASSAACSSVKVMISKPLLFEFFCSPSSSSSSSSSSMSWLSRPITVRHGACYHCAPHARQLKLRRRCVWNETLSTWILRQQQEFCWEVTSDFQCRNNFKPSVHFFKKHKKKFLACTLTFTLSPHSFHFLLHVMKHPTGISASLLCCSTACSFFICFLHSRLVLKLSSHMEHLKDLMWIIMWRFKLPLVVNEASQTLHLKGFTPVDERWEMRDYILNSLMKKVNLTTSKPQNIKLVCICLTFCIFSHLPYFLSAKSPYLMFNFNYIFFNPVLIKSLKNKDFL